MRRHGGRCSGGTGNNGEVHFQAQILQNYKADLMSF